MIEEALEMCDDINCEGVNEMITDNKHYNYQKLQQIKCSTSGMESIQSVAELDRMLCMDVETIGMENNIRKSEILKLCDFREMARFQENKRGKVKRLQAGP